jgi:hypothetical protein
LSNRKRRKPGAYSHLYGNAQPTGNTDPRTLGGDIAGPGGPHDRGAVLLDMTDCVFLDAVDVAAVDGVRDGHGAGHMVYMTLGGRVNKTDRRAQVGYMLNTDGVAALITQLLALADRTGTSAVKDLARRLAELHSDGTANLRTLRTVITAVIDTIGGERPCDH